MVIHMEENPNVYTNPGPPINPKALIIAAADANAMVKGPKLFVPPKNCSAVFAFLDAYIPIPIDINKKTTEKPIVKALGTMSCSTPAS